MYSFDEYLAIVRRLLREIRQIREDCGYSTDNILMAMLVAAVMCGTSKK